MLSFCTAIVAAAALAALAVLPAIPAMAAKGDSIETLTANAAEVGTAADDSATEFYEAPSADLIDPPVDPPVVDLIKAPAPAASPPPDDEAQICTDLTEGLGYEDKVDTSGDPATVEYTAPAGFLVDAYCVKAGTVPVIVPVSPPSASVIIDHPDKDSVSHYQVHLIPVVVDEDPEDAEASATTPPGGCDYSGGVEFSVFEATWEDLTDLSDGERVAFANEGHKFPGGLSKLIVTYTINGEDPSLCQPDLQLPTLALTGGGVPSALGLWLAGGLLFLGVSGLYMRRRYGVPTG